MYIYIYIYVYVDLQFYQIIYNDLHNPSQAIQTANAPSKCLIWIALGEAAPSWIYCYMVKRKTWPNNLTKTRKMFDKNSMFYYEMAGKLCS